MNIKQNLFNQCEAFVNKRAQTVEEIISSNQKALQSETKSSAGDKHETGRAMLQLEMEKASHQLSGIQEMKEILSKIDISKNSTIAHLGSIIETDSVNYFLSISAGQLIVNDKVYFAVSVSSPIGKLLLGKTMHDELIFNGKKSKITLVI
ncbi:3-oxoacyl-ACP synthase [uncultured Polaribacter sp.]|uniref:3-oxoacyl-ACP synthase n=1 Tax=uncultured Polaribacter sp. TaxID=174711 RepID=UPI0030DDD07E|tara:strand:+ start:530 stop:979 length:450 start_codon:yes stop_codon:yes gene_type:complete